MKASGSRVGGISRQTPYIAGLLFLLIVFIPVYVNVFGNVDLSETTMAPVLYVGNDGKCDDIRMFGDENDAGWWLCWPKGFESTKENCKVLSWGIQDHFDFDEAIVEQGCEVHGFDPSPLGLGSNVAYEKMGGIYHTYGLGGVDKTYPPGTAPFNWPGIKYLRASNPDTWVLKSVSTTIADTIPTAGSGLGSSLTVLKIDVEGSEWDVIDQLVHAHWDQLLVELHFPPTEYHLSDAGNGKGFVITRLPHKGFYNAMFPPTKDYIALWQKIMAVSDMWRYHFNVNDRARACLEVYLTRKQL
jgi:hypothetical protein